MKVLVCISKVPDTTTKIAFTDNNTKFNEDGVKYILNPTDEWYALVRGIEVKEKHGGSVTIVSVGDASYDFEMNKALAIGADDAVRIDAVPTDPYFVAAQIAAYAKTENFDIIITGKETIDYNGGIVGGLLAEMMDLPFVSLATTMTIEGNTATIEREIVGGKEIVEVNTPFAISANKGLADQRIPNMRGIMMARKKPKKVLPPFDGISPMTNIVSYEAVPPRSTVKLVDADNVAELVRLLHEEAKII